MGSTYRFSTWLEKIGSIISSLRMWLGRELDEARRQAFQVVAGLITLLLLIALVEELLGKPAPEATTVGALVLSLLTAAFLAAYGREVAGRIKKIGPIELLEGQKASRELDEIAGEVIKAGEVAPLTDPFTKVELSARQQFYFREGERLLIHLKLSGSEPEAGAGRDIFWELLFKIGYTATTQLEWMKAMRWLLHLEKLSRGSYRPDEVSNYLAFSNVLSALQETGGLRRKHLLETVKRFAPLAKQGMLDYVGYFWLAYAQDELGQWHEAVSSNLETLNRRPRHAPARYNAANSLLKLGRFDEAYLQLKCIGPQDEQIDTVTTTAAGDEEIRSRITVTACAPTTQQQLLGELGRLSALGVWPGLTWD